MAYADHIGPSPTAAATAVLTELSQFKMVSGVGPVRTIKRLAEDQAGPELLEAIDRQLTAGLPGFLVAASGRGFVREDTAGKRYKQRVHVTIICAANKFSGQADRLSGDSSEPGVEDLLDWATYYGARALEAVSGLTLVGPQRHRWLRFEAAKYVAAVDFLCTRRINIWSDDPANTLQKLGIVHEPLDPEDLWEEDNETPKSEMPPTTDGGVVTL